MRQTRSVWVATPYGRDGMGGIDRLNDAIFDFVGHHPELDTRLTRLVTRGKRGLLNAQFVFAYALARFAVAAVRGKVDLLHIHISGHGSSYRKAVLGMLAHRLGIPYVVHLHGVNYREFWAGTNPPLRHALDQLYRRSMGNIVLGNFWAGVILERLPETKSTIIVLPNATSVAVGVDRRRTENNGRLRVTFLGQLGSRKGTPLLIEALTRLRHRDNWIATVAGDGDIAQTRAAVESGAITDRVEISGWLDLEAKTRLLQMTDILVLPSFAENLPMVIIEAFAHGIAVIATPVGAIAEALESEKTGLLVPVGDVDALETALARLLDDNALRQRLGAAARLEHQNRFELNGYIRRLVANWRRASGTELPALPAQAAEGHPAEPARLASETPVSDAPPSAAKISAEQGVHFIR